MIGGQAQVVNFDCSLAFYFLFKLYGMGGVTLCLI